MKKEEEYLAAVNNSVFQPERKRMRNSSVPLVEKAMVQWTKNLRSSHPTVPLSGDLLREKAVSFASQLGYKDFKASVGWLGKHKKRNGIVSKVLSGESASVSEQDCQTYVKDILPGLLQDYSENDIFNADETGLFYKCLPDKTLAYKSENCHGGKKSKDRITVMIAANMSGT